MARFVADHSLLVRNEGKGLQPCHVAPRAPWFPLTVLNVSLPGGSLRTWSNTVPGPWGCCQQWEWDRAAGLQLSGLWNAGNPRPCCLVRVPTGGGLQRTRPSVCCSRVRVAEPMSTVVFSRQTQRDLCVSDPGGGRLCWWCHPGGVGGAWHCRGRNSRCIPEWPVVTSPAACQFCRVTVPC